MPSLVQYTNIHTMKYLANKVISTRHVVNYHVISLITYLYHYLLDSSSQASKA